MNSPYRTLLACIALAALALMAGCSVGENQSETKNIFGNDDRINAPDQYPYRAVGRLDSGCTGTLISDSLVLTAAHCIVDSRTGTVKINLGWFRPNLRNNNTTGPAAWITRAWVGGENPDGNRLRDFAVLEIDTPLGRQLGSLSVRDFNIEQQLPFRTDLIGYSTDRNNGADAGLHRGCLIREIVQDRLFHECDGYAGVSGGPLLNTVDATTYISGITVSEFRNGEPNSVRRDSYSKEYANVALPAKNFSALVSQLLSTVARGQPAPVIPDITYKINPEHRPTVGGGGGGDQNYTLDRVVREQDFIDNEMLLRRMMEDLRYENDHLVRWAYGIRDPRLDRLARELEDATRTFNYTVEEAARGQFRGAHKNPVFAAWKSVSLAVKGIEIFPRSSGRLALEQEMNRYMSPVSNMLKQIEGRIFD